MIKSQFYLTSLTGRSQKIDKSNYKTKVNLDVFGSSFTPRLRQTSPQLINQMSKTITTQYEDKKFKIRFWANSVKTGRSHRSSPFQRIKKVQNWILQRQKQQQNQRSLINIQQDIIYNSVPISPKKKQNSLNFTLPIHNNYEKKMKIDINNFNQYNTTKQNQQINYKQSRRKINKQQKQKLQQPKSIVKINFENQLLNEYKKKQNILDQEYHSNKNINNQNKITHLNQVNINKNKANLYSQIVKNRKKLTQKRKNKKHSHQFSLLSRISNINKSDIQNSFFLKSRRSYSINNEQSQCF